MSPSKDEDRLLDHQYDEHPGVRQSASRLVVADLHRDDHLGASCTSSTSSPGSATGKGRVASYEGDMKAAAEKYGTPQEQAAKPRSIDGRLMLAALEGPGAAGGRQGDLRGSVACSSCHLADGGGIIGPNLTDDYWIHGAQSEGHPHHDHQRRSRQGHAHLGAGARPGEDAPRSRPTCTPCTARIRRSPRSRRARRYEYDANGPVAARAGEHQDRSSVSITRAAPEESPAMAVEPQPVKAPGACSRRSTRTDPVAGSVLVRLRERGGSRRRVTAYALMFVFFAIPYLQDERASRSSCWTCRTASSRCSAPRSCPRTRCSSCCCS